MIRSGIDVNTQIEDESCEHGSTALMWATLYGREHSEMIRLLIDAGANVNTQAEQWGDRLIYTLGTLAKNHTAGIIHLLLDAGADTNMQEDFGHTALMKAIMKGDEYAEVIMRLLVDAGADVDKQDSNGETALIILPLHGGEHATGMMRLLLDAGADVNKLSVCLSV